MNTPSTPSPAVMAKFKPAVATLVVATPESPTNPLLGVVKAITLVKGQKVRAFAKGAPRGVERTVERKVVLDNNLVRITFTGEGLTEAERTREYKAAYRFHDAEIAASGKRPTRRPQRKPAPVEHGRYTLSSAGLTPYQEV